MAGKTFGEFTVLMVAIGTDQCAVITGKLFQFLPLSLMAGQALRMGFFREFDFKWPMRIPMAVQALQLIVVWGSRMTQTATRNIFKAFRFMPGMTVATGKFRTMCHARLGNIIYLLDMTEATE